MEAEVLAYIRGIAGKYSTEERTEEVQEIYKRLLAAGNSYYQSSVSAPILASFEAQYDATEFRKNLYD